mgnify:CR=1 FL=1
MFLRIDRLQVEMPLPDKPDPVAAAAVQELMGGRFGEMTTLNTYMYQSFNFRQRGKLRPYYALIANIATEELGHIELVGAAVNGLLNGIQPKGSIEKGEASFAGQFILQLLMLYRQDVGIYEGCGVKWFVMYV